MKWMAKWVFIYLFIYFWLCWVFVSLRGLSLVVASGGHSSSRCTGLLLLRPLFLWSTGSRRAGSIAVAHGPSCSAACGILPDQGSNPCPLHWQADSQPLRHQGSPSVVFLGLGVLHWLQPMDGARARVWRIVHMIDGPGFEVTHITDWPELSQTDTHNCKRVWEMQVLCAELCPCPQVHISTLKP